MEKQFKKIILDWIKKNYGEHERYNPCYDIKALAKELDRHFHDLWWKEEMRYLEEDVETYARDHDIELTEQQVHDIAEDIRLSEWYCSIDPENMEYYIKQVKEK